jgi:hypothetical protein
LLKLSDANDDGHDAAEERPAAAGLPRADPDADPASTTAP